MGESGFLWGFVVEGGWEMFGLGFSRSFGAGCLVRLLLRRTPDRSFDDASVGLFESSF